MGKSKGDRGKDKRGGTKSKGKNKEWND